MAGRSLVEAAICPSRPGHLLVVIGERRNRQDGCCHVALRQPAAGVYRAPPTAHRNRDECISILPPVGISPLKSVLPTSKLAYLAI